ncbi:MAG: SDR family NAD(P)-dependent oxidoreductase [Candidatus Acidiferrales bacterium]
MDSKFPLKGQHALVTGASRGIGLAIARRLGQMGARITLCGRTEKTLGEASARLQQEGIETFAFPANVASHDQVSALVDAAIAKFGGIDILVNNAGVGRFAPIHEFSDADWDTVLDTNLKGVFLASRAVIPGMISRGRGHIVNISSLAGKNSFPGGSIYCASKWGLLGLTYSMAEDLRAHGIRVAAVCPGSVATEFSPHANKDPRKMLQAEDVAHAVAMILTEAPQSFISEVLLRPTQKP